MSQVRSRHGGRVLIHKREQSLRIALAGLSLITVFGVEHPGNAEPIDTHAKTG
jgi:hypothetical protein